MITISLSRLIDALEQMCTISGLKELNDLIKLKIILVNSNNPEDNL